MSRRHHHHMQPYDYDRFTDHSRDRDQTRGIEYQDDSLSSINSDEDSYLHHTHPGKDKKLSYYMKNEASSKSKSEKPSEIHHQKESKGQSHVNNHVDNTSDRLGRLESMLEQLIKRNDASPQAASVPEKSVSEMRGVQGGLELKRHKVTTSLWINNIQEMSVQNNWDEKTTIQYMESQMSGIIKAWYNCLANYDYTWPEWKMLIAQVFPDNVDFVTTLKRLVTRLKKRDENVTSYYFSKMYLIEACKITGEDAVSCLIDGLNNQAIQEKAKSQNFVTPEMLYSQFLMALPEYTVDYSPMEPVQQQGAMWDQWYYQQEQMKEQANVEKPGPSEQQFQFESNDQDEEQSYHNQDNSEFPGNKEHVHLKNKRTGPVHSRLDKRFISPDKQKQAMLGKVCLNCFKRGHLARTCWAAKKAMYCRLKGSQLEESFFKDCAVNDTKLSALVDTGCNTVTIRESEARALDLDVHSTSGFVEVFGGGRVDVVGEAIFVLELDSVKRPVKATVVPDSAQNVSVIVGQSFLIQKNICVFLQNGILNVFEASQEN